MTYLEEIKARVKALNENIEELMELDADGFAWQINSLIYERDGLIHLYLDEEKGVDKPQTLWYTINTVKKREVKKMVRVIIRDTRFNENNYLELTDDQYRLLDWIEGKEFMEDVEVEIAESYDFQKI